MTLQSDQVFIVFDEEILLRLDELIRYESVTAQDGEKLPKGAAFAVIPDDVRTRVYTQHTGYFYTAMTVADINERIQDSILAAGGVL